MKYNLLVFKYPHFSLDISFECGLPPNIFFHLAEKITQD